MNPAYVNATSQKAERPHRTPDEGAAHRGVPRAPDGAARKLDRINHGGRAPGVEFVRVPGLFRRWELTEVIDGHGAYRVEAAGRTDDGVALFAVFHQPETVVLAPARAVPVTFSLGTNEPPFRARILLVESAYPLTAVLVMSDLATEPGAIDRLTHCLRRGLDGEAERDDVVADLDDDVAEGALVPGPLERLTRELLDTARATRSAGAVASAAVRHARGAAPTAKREGRL